MRRLRAARRLRWELPALRGDLALAGRIERSLSRRSGVRRVTASARTGRVLVEYEEEVPGPVELARLLEPLAPGPGWNQEGGAAPSQVSPPPGEGSEAQAQPWHALPSQEVLALLRAAEVGLTVAEAARRLRLHGPNMVAPIPGRSPLAILRDQLVNLPTAALLGCAGLSWALGDLLDAAAIAGIVGLNTSIGFRMERQSEGLLRAWQRLEAGQARVLRDGRVETISAAELVPGDVILCHEGALVPADARVLAVDQLACDEAVLTGESVPRDKRASPVAPKSVLAERDDMVYGGTRVVTGRGRAVVVATGAATEVAHIRALVAKTAAPVGRMQWRLHRAAIHGTRFGIAVAVGVAALDLLRGRGMARALRGAVALGVASVPEGLPLIATTALVRSMQRLRGQEIIVRRVGVPDALGAVSVVCLDKTGTLTQNAMWLDRVEVGDEWLAPEAIRFRASDPLHEGPALALAAAALNSVADGGGRQGPTGGGPRDREPGSGSSTERAIVEAAGRAGVAVEQMRQAFPRLALRQRGDGAYYVVSLHGAPGGGEVAFLKGAPEQVLELCARDTLGPLDPRRRRRWNSRNQALAASGRRVLAVAWRRVVVGGGLPSQGFTFLGLLGLRDPLRAESAGTIAAVVRAGVRTLVVTGDQRATAGAVARELGLMGAVLDGAEVLALLRADRRRGLAALGRAGVVARVSPADKLHIVGALREAGEVVAMAGDGVNDAPALKAADVGIAVGGQADELALQTADVVLLGGDLSKIVAAIHEGRAIHQNLQRTVRFLFATNLSEVLLTLGAAIVDRPVLSPLQLLWINLVTDTLPALAIALEPHPREALHPSPSSALVDSAGWRRIVRDGALIALIGGAGIFGPPLMPFTLLVGAQLGYAAWCRGRAGPPDAAFVGWLGAAVALQTTGLVVPPLRRLLALK